MLKLDYFRLQRLFSPRSRPRSASLFWTFFLGMVNIFILQKISPERDRLQPFLDICYNFRQIFCTNVIQFFSVENMGHNQLQKCTKYHLVSLLNEKQGSTFANFLHFFYPVTLLTHSALNHYSIESGWLKYISPLIFVRYLPRIQICMLLKTLFSVDKVHIAVSYFTSLEKVTCC